MTNEAGNDRILLVDDEKHLLISLRDYLVFEKFDVTVAQSGEEALQKLAEGLEPDLIILDISMPGMGGLGFLRSISDAEGKPRYAVLVLTARSKMEEFFGSVNVDGFLAKPCDEAKLLRKMREILASHKMAKTVTKRARQRVLLAEDDGGRSRSIQDALQSAGYDVDIVASGPEILEQGPTIVPDLIVMKEVLPRLNGSAVASLISVMPSVAHVPVIIYDETLGEGEEIPSRYSSAKCVKKVLRSSATSLVVNAASEILG